MVLLDDAIYEETKKIVLGKSKRSPMLIEFSDWSKRMFSVNVLNLEFGKLKYPKTKRYHLYVIVENTEDYRKMYEEAFKLNEDYQSQIESEFRKIASKYKFAAEEQLENLFVSYNDFSQEAKTEANWKAEKEVKDFIKVKYSVVWDVLTMFSNSVIFYYVDSDIATNESKGISEAITNDYFSILKKYDDLNYFRRENICLKFDSKENLDKNYEGNFFYYSR
jgi:hypothetical protein